ncbi:MAG: redoxin domain-containing protein [candidate division NC10 bacterium]|uniref:Redoxin domain-containing protein n=1 Tax=Tectimicrobiota bacterium TaxID=2528274 RepID=A0A932I361_UNCTE|nr:redoxin domain-containing protein [candidate division NC10 bacterium]MBI3128344.1 redoxin domain-containing protein [Candidatus Tectomicrobia bacterium]
MEELHGMYKDKGVEFFVVYSREPHAGERKYFRKYSQHTSYAHKLQYAQELVREFGMKVPVLVDDLEETVAKAFGWMPNMVYVIDTEGKIAYKASWTDKPRVDRVLDDLLAEQAGKEAMSTKA